MFVRVSLFVVAALLLGAHFLRSGSSLFVILCVATPFLFLYKRRWSLFLLQTAAYCGTAIWLAVAWQLVVLRQQIGQPWTAAAIILGGVAMLTLVSGLLLNSRCMRDRYETR